MVFQKNILLTGQQGSLRRLLFVEVEPRAGPSQLQLPPAFRRARLHIRRQGIVTSLPRHPIVVLPQADTRRGRRSVLAVRERGNGGKPFEGGPLQPACHRARHRKNRAVGVVRCFAV